MGIYDRDYYREKHEKRRRAHNQRFLRARKRGNRAVEIKHFLYAVIVLGLYWLGADRLSPRDGLPSFAAPKIIPGGMVLHRDRQGHYRGVAYINGIAMPFMIDTGATLTAIPKSLAVRAGLPFGRPMTAHTAGGTVMDYRTRLQQIRIGNAVLKDVPASINEHIDEVLLGMNVLKHFILSQDGDTLTLRARGYDGQIVNVPPVAGREIRKASAASGVGFPVGNDSFRNPPRSQPRQSVRIVKRSICSIQNGKKTCITEFSDH